MNSDYKKFVLDESISAEQRNFFDEHGFIHFKNFITPSTVELIIRASLEVQKKWIKAGVKKVNGVPINMGWIPMALRLCSDSPLSISTILSWLNSCLIPDSKHFFR